VQLCRAEGTIRLQRPLVLDLGAVVKGLAIDLVARDLAARGFQNVSVDAGGDLYARGLNAHGDPWRVGVKHPRADGLLPHLVAITDGAVCTSGDYERRAPDGSAHVVDARYGSDPTVAVTSVSVLAPTAMAADGLSTAAMLLGPIDGLALLQRERVDGLLVLADETTRITGTAFTDAV
jgi:thiamine biosynthesis lipoprotein